ncbi:hypothetical protein ABFS83_02G168900 [Erythranthe nasuta]
MAEQEEITDPGQESFVDRITDKLHGSNDDSSSSSSSDSDSDAKKTAAAPPSPVKEEIGREKPVHKVFGGGKPADIFLWRDKKISGGVLGGVTAVWVLFELLEYHLLTLVCHIVIFTLSMLFLWSNVTIFINKRPPPIPVVNLSEEPFVGVAVALRNEINRTCAVLREIASGRDLKKFLVVVAVLWFFSIVGSCCNFLTLFYLVFVLLLTVPVLYEKYNEKIDAFTEKATVEIKKQYAVFDAKFLCKIPKGPFDKKRA